MSVVLTAQISPGQSTQEYTLTATSTSSASTAIRLSEDVLDQEWCNNYAMMTSPSTHERSPDFLFGEQRENTAMPKSPSRCMDDSFIIIHDADGNDSPQDIMLPTEEGAAPRGPSVEYYQTQLRC